MFNAIKCFERFAVIFLLSRRIIVFLPSQKARHNKAVFFNIVFAKKRQSQHFNHSEFYAFTQVK